MKIKYLIIGLILILLFSVLAISTAEAKSINDYNFTIPDDYHIENCSDDYALLKSDQYHSISICVLDSSTDKDLLKYLLEGSMYDFTYEKNYTKGSYDIEESHYNQEYQRGILYICENGDDLVVIDYKVPVIESLDDSPVDVILDGLD